MNTQTPLDIPELLCYIGSYISKKDISWCFLVCKSWSIQLAPFRLESFIVVDRFHMSLDVYRVNSELIKRIKFKMVWYDLPIDKLCNVVSLHSNIKDYLNCKRFNLFIYTIIAKSMNHLQEVAIHCPIELDSSVIHTLSECP
jgi:hypothetical protein